jgi:hypothetical protein
VAGVDEQLHVGLKSGPPKPIEQGTPHCVETLVPQRIMCFSDQWEMLASGNNELVPSMCLSPPETLAMQKEVGNLPG